jgi:hypothetical protein
MKTTLSREERTGLTAAMRQAQRTLQLARRSVESDEREAAAQYLVCLREQVEILLRGLR